MTIQDQLISILDTMDIPKERKNLNLHNLLWLNRNIGFRNQKHLYYQEALKLIKEMIIKEKLNN